MVRKIVNRSDVAQTPHGRKRRPVSRPSGTHFRLVKEVDGPASAPFDYQPATRVLYGCGAIRRLGEVGRDLGGRRVLVVTDPHLVAAGHVAHGVESLLDAQLEPVVFDGAEENPTTRHVAACVAFAREQRVDLIVGLGGGSSMDCARGCNFVLTNGG